MTRSYLRTAMLERRRKVMADWAAFGRGRRDGGPVQAMTQAEARPVAPARRLVAAVDGDRLAPLLLRFMRKPG